MENKDIMGKTHTVENKVIKPRSVTKSDVFFALLIVSLGLYSIIGAYNSGWVEKKVQKIDSQEIKMEEYASLQDSLDSFSEGPRKKEIRDKIKAAFKNDGYIDRKEGVVIFLLIKKENTRLHDNSLNKIKSNLSKLN